MVRIASRHFSLSSSRLTDTAVAKIHHKITGILLGNEKGILIVSSQCLRLIFLSRAMGSRRKQAVVAVGEAHMKMNLTKIEVDDEPHLQIGWPLDEVMMAKVCRSYGATPAT